MKILAMTHPGTNSRGLFLDMVQGVRDLGHEVLQLELGPVRDTFVALRRQGESAMARGGDLIHELIERNGVDLTMAMWSNGVHGLPICHQPDGTSLSLLERHGHPLLFYWWDAPHWASEGQELDYVPSGLYGGEHQFHCINNPGTASEMSMMGFRNVIPQPNGVNPDRFRPQPGIRQDYDLVFISGSGDPPPTPVMLEELKRDEPDVDRIRRDVAASLGPALDRLAAGFDEPVQQPMRRLLDGIVEARLSARHRPALVHLREALRRWPDLAPAADTLVRDVHRYVRVMSTIRGMEEWERPFLVAYLSRHFRCLRVGQQAYDAWGVEGDATGFVDYDRQSEVYARGRVALNVSRWQDDVGVNSKIFEITATGVACLQAYRGGVEELFEAGREILVFRSPGEARERLAEALASGRVEELAAAGRQRTLRDHTWAARMDRVLDLVATAWRQRGRPVERPVRVAAGPPAVSPTGHRLAFVLSPMRSGSTLLRRMISAHPCLASPPETWFLLPLLNLWEGEGDGPGFNRRQAAVALQSVADHDTFVDACRAFASQLYSRHLPPGGACVVDKTPMYLKIAHELARLFPEAKFIVLVREPRATAWSLHTWAKAPTALDAAIVSTAANVRCQYDFSQAHPGRVHVVRYEDLCCRPEPACDGLCRFLGTRFDPAMIDYGTHGDPTPGYGDEKALQHGRPHTQSLRRWGVELTEARQRRLAEACTAEVLRFFGYEELGDLAVPSVAGVA
jgi:glycosyltransferase involved in cell wall biosynthesis